jgi:hypothetical protein
MPTQARVIDAFAQGRLGEVELHRVRQVIAPSCRAYVERLALHTAQQVIAPSYRAYVGKLALKGVSILASLAPRELDEGLAALRAYVAEVEDRTITEPLDVFILRGGT